MNELEQNNNKFLILDNIQVHFPLTQRGVIKKVEGIIYAVDGITIALAKGETLGVVGESGCGKTTLARAIVGLVPLTGGEVLFEGKSFFHLSSQEMKKIRSRIQMIFQDPYSSLNPRMTVFDTLSEPLRFHKNIKRSDCTSEVSRLMEQVGLAPRFMRKYPHEFSGGQRQRIAIARALAPEPEIIIADEPVSALDVSIQAQILNLLRRLCQNRQLTMIFISHDFAVIRHICERIVVMYRGRVMETGSRNEIFNNPLHPYTRALLSAVVVPDPKRAQPQNAQALAGEPTSPLNQPQGCVFSPRCNYVIDKCKKEPPALEACQHKSGHKAACIRKGDFKKELKNDSKI